MDRRSSYCPLRVSPWTPRTGTTFSVSEKPIKVTLLNLKSGLSSVIRRSRLTMLTEAKESEVVMAAPARPMRLSVSLRTALRQYSQKPVELTRKWEGLLVPPAEKGKMKFCPPIKSVPMLSRLSRNCWVNTPACTCEPPMCMMLTLPSPRKTTESILVKKRSMARLSPGKMRRLRSKWAKLKSSIGRSKGSVWAKTGHKASNNPMATSSFFIYS